MTFSDIPPAAPVVAEVERLLARVHRVDGTAPLSEQGIRVITGDARFAHTIVTRGGRVVGVAVVLTDSDAAEPSAASMGEVAVDPDHRNQGIGTELVDAVLGRVRSVWAHGDMPAAQRVAAKLLLTPVRELWQMRRPTIDELPPVPERDDVLLRTFRPGDEQEILRVNNLAFAWHPEQGGWTGADLDDRFAEPWFDPAGLIVAEDRGGSGLRGFHWTKVHEPDPDGGEPNSLGEVYVVAVDPAAHGRGLGSVLTLAGLHHLRSAGPEVLLYVEADNTAAVHTYRRLGFTRFHTDVAYARS